MKKFVVIAALLIIAYSCTEVPPTQEIKEAQKSIEEAQAMKADKYAPEMFKEARNDFAKANDKMEAKKYKDAKKYAVSAKDKAVSAIDIAAPKYSKAMSVKRKIEDAEHGLESVQRLYKLATQQYEKKFEILQFGDLFKQIEKDIADAKAYSDSEDYYLAESDAKHAKDKADKMKLKIESVTKADLRVKPYIGKTVYLWYDGMIRKIELWSKPGARSTGARVVKELLKSRSRVPCLLLGQSTTDHGSNYFLIRLQDGTEGWIGRSFVFRTRTGSRHIIPNPLTGAP